MAKKHSESKEEHEKYIVVSYMPLLQSDTRFLSNPDEQHDFEHSQAVAKKLSETIDDLPEVHIQACLWMSNQDEGQTVAVTPVFLIDNADEVMEHLVYWSEEDPASWFRLYVEKIDEQRYVVMLFPNLAKSIKRFNVACIQFSEFIPKSDADYMLLFKPLEFISQSAVTFDNIKQFITGELTLGFLNTSDFNPESPNDCADKIKYAGPFSTVLDATEDKFIESYIKNIPEDA